MYLLLDSGTDCWIDRWKDWQGESSILLITNFTDRGIIYDVEIYNCHLKITKVLHTTFLLTVLCLCPSSCTLCALGKYWDNYYCGIIVFFHLGNEQNHTVLTANVGRHLIKNANGTKGLRGPSPLKSSVGLVKFTWDLRGQIFGDASVHHIMAA